MASTSSASGAATSTSSASGAATSTSSASAGCGIGEPLAELVEANGGELVQDFILHPADSIYATRSDFVAVAQRQSFIR